jgi:hypothetical protein
MTIAKLFIPAALVTGILVMTACSHIFSPEASITLSHPEALPEGRPVCSDCHGEQQLKGTLKPYTVFNHTQLFIKDHRFSAGRDEKICGVCHATSFCNDCHANELEIKPSLKLGNRPDRELIHRGDFLTRHKIEGKIDPTSCYRCHGRTNNEQCLACHR